MMEDSGFDSDQKIMQNDTDRISLQVIDDFNV